MAQLQFFSTRTSPKHMRFQLWEERLRAALGDVRAKSSSEAEFDAWVEGISDRGVSIIRVRACGHELELGSPSKESSADRVHVIFPLSGHLLLEQFGRRTVLQAGNWGYFMPGQPFRHVHDVPAELLVLGTPRTTLLSEGAMEQFSAQSFSAGKGCASLVKGYLETLEAQRACLHPMITSDLVATAVRLVRMSLMETLGIRGEIGVREMQQARIKEFVDQNLQNAKLDIAMVAQAQQCSKRYVHKVFSAAGETLSHYILRSRLERCRHDLQRPELAHLSLTEIAFSWGFNSPEHFSRVFRSHFGVRPKDYRKAPHEAAR